MILKSKKMAPWCAMQLLGDEYIRESGLACEFGISKLVASPVYLSLGSLNSPPRCIYHWGVSTPR
jgi:hypothetical protein